MKSFLILSLIVLSFCGQYDEQVWKYFKDKGFTDAGVAALMENLNAESGINSEIYQTSYKSKIGCSAKELCDKINSGQYTKEQFISDSVGFGLAQWTSKSRKEQLYDSCQGKIGSIDC